MKKIFKTMWYSWNTLDRIIAVSSMILIITFCICSISCTAQTTTDIPAQEYYDWDNIPDGGILMYPDGVIDFIYCTEDGEYIIEYNDPDAFDYDNITHTATCATSDSTVDYIQIYCSEKLFYEYLEWYNSLTLEGNKELFFEPSSKYFIKLMHCGNPSEGYDYYILVTN